MRNKWIFGALLFISISGNIVQLSMQMGKEAARHSQPIREIIGRMNGLEEGNKETIAKIVKNSLVDLLKQKKEWQQLRKETFSYIASDSYNRSEAEERFKLLRGKTSQLQASAQEMALKIADALPKEERQKILKISDNTP